MFTMRFDMRAPDFGAPARELYAAALDHVEWADGLGFDSVGLGEHHASPDGYDPSPLILASAMGGRTRRSRFRTAVVLAPLYDPIKLAEARTTYGVIGVKVWVFRGEVFESADATQEQAEPARQQQG